MSRTGMEMHETPKFWLEDDEQGSSCFWWHNPYCNGKKEKVATLWWPEHPEGATEAVEALFETLELRVRTANGHSCGKHNVSWRGAVMCPECQRDREAERKASESPTNG